MINNLMRDPAVVLEDVEVACAGCGSDLFGDGLFDIR